MTTLSESQINGCTFDWKIENISHSFWLEGDVGLVSPTFICDAFHGAKWSLSLYPMGNEDKDFVAFFLLREVDNGPDVIEVNYHLAFLDKFASVLEEEYSFHNFKRGHRHGYQRFISRKKVFFIQRYAFIHEDTLTVTCTLYKPSTKIFNLKHIYARTILQLKRKSVLWKINKFSKVQTDLINKFKDNLIDLDLILSNGDFKIGMISIDDNIKYVSVDISIVRLGKTKRRCGHYQFNLTPTDFFFGSPKGPLNIMSLPKSVMKCKELYSSNDVLSLDIKYTYSAVINSYEFHDSVRNSTKSTEEVAKNDNQLYAREESQSLSGNLRSMYTDGIFSDIQLHTSSRTFPVHKSVLSARSPVFRRMFSHDMKEKNSGNINISDLEDDTVHRMLLFIYTDLIEDLQFESASKLYVAADKYEILSLKSKCSSFLKDNMCPSKACHVLLLADQHQDQDLKSVAQAYILDHNEVFGLQEWKDFMETNVKLAADIMYRKIYPCNI